MGLAYLAKAYGVTAMDPDAPNYQSVLSDWVAAVFGRGWFYFLTMGGVLAGAVVQREHGVCGLPAPGAGDRACRTTCRTCSCCAGAGCCFRMESMR